MLSLSHCEHCHATQKTLQITKRLLIIAAMTETDTRSPCPPLGYSRECLLPEDRQIELVAEFHSYRIRPTRIAYRLGIDIALIDALLAGDYKPRRFNALVRHHRQRRLNKRLTSAERQKGQRAFELRQRALADFDTEVDI